MANIMAPAARYWTLLAGVLMMDGALSATSTLPSAVNTLPDAYSLSMDPSNWSDTYSVFHLAVAEPFGQLGSAFAVSDDPHLKPLTRLDTSLSTTAPGSALPLRLGDGISSVGFWNQPARMGGVQIGTLSSVPPAVFAPLATVAQPFDVAAPVSQSTSQFIDQLRSLIQVQKQALEAPGQGDFSVESGRLRESFAIRSSDYGPWIASGTYRYGVNANTTVDGQIAQVARQQNFLGVGFIERLGPLGLVSAKLASSRDQDAYGWLARMGYDYSQDRVSVALRSHIQSPGFLAVGDATTIESFRQRTLASAHVDLGALGKLSLASATQTYADESRRDLFALSHAVRFGGGGIVSAAAAYSPGPVGNAALALSFTYPLDHTSLSDHRTDGAITTALDRSIVEAFGQSRPPRRTINE